MRDDYFKKALKIIGDPTVLTSMIAGRVKMLRHGSRPVFECPEDVPIEDIALREIIEGRITYVLGDIVVLEDPRISEDTSGLTGAASPAQ
jgi:DNA-directed RNA polymerase subunit omega